MSSHAPGRIRTWWRALRPLAQANVLPPIVVGAAALDPALPWSWMGLGVSAGFGVLAHGVIVLANDVADAPADARAGRRTVVSGGSRVIVEGLLSRRKVAAAAALAAVACCVYVTAWSLLRASPWPAVLGAATILLVWAYCFPPLRLAYRSGGAWAQAAGVGVVLPLVGWFGQGGTGWPPQAAGLLPTAALGWAGHVLTALPDLAGDRSAGKRTLPVRIGARAARRRAALVLVLAAAATPFLVPPGPPSAWAAVETVAALVSLVLLRLVRDPVGFAVGMGGLALALQAAWAALARLP